MLEKLYKYLPQSCWVYCCISVLALILLGIIGIGPDNWMYLNGYRTFLDYPVENMFFFQWYLTYWIGAILGLKTLVASRIFGGIVTMMIWGIAYLWLRKTVGKKMLGLGLTLATMGLFGTATDFNYNNGSLLFMVVGLYCLSLGRRKVWLCAISGIVMGMALFFRLPNLSFIIIGICPLFLLLIEKKYKIAHSLLQVAFFYVGYVLGVMLIFALMIPQGHDVIFVDMLRMAANSTASGKNNEHSLIPLLIHTSKCYLVPLLISGLGLGCAKFCITRKFFLVGGKYNYLLIVCLVVFFYLIGKSAAMIYWTIFTPILLYSLFSKNKVVDKYDVLMAGIMMYVFPLGCASIMSFCAPYVFWLTIPLALNFIWVNRVYFIKLQHLFATLLIALIIVITIKDFVFKTYSIYQGQYRFNSFTTMNDESVNGILTTKENASIENTIKLLEKYIPKESYLVTDNSSFSVLLKAAPFGLSSYFLPDSYKLPLVAKSLEKTHQLPYIIVNKVNEDYDYVKYLRQMGQYKTIRITEDLTLYKPLSYLK